MITKNKSAKSHRHRIMIGLILVTLILSCYTLMLHQKRGARSLQILTDNQEKIDKMNNQIETLNYTNQDKKIYYDKIMSAHKTALNQFDLQKKAFDKLLFDTYQADNTRKKLLSEIEKKMLKQKVPAGKELVKNSTGFYELIKTMPTESEAKKYFPEIWRKAVHFAGLVHDNTDIHLAFSLFQNLYDTNLPFKNDDWPQEVIDTSNQTIVEIGTNEYDIIMETNFFGDHPTNAYAEATDFKADNYQAELKEQDEQKKALEEKNTPPSYQQALAFLKESSLYNKDNSYQDIKSGTDKSGGFRIIQIHYQRETRTTNSSSTSLSTDDNKYNYAKVYSSGTIHYSENRF